MAFSFLNSKLQGATLEKGRKSKPVPGIEHRRTRQKLVRRLCASPGETVMLHLNIGLKKME